MITSIVASADDSESGFSIGGPEGIIIIGLPVLFVLFWLLPIYVGYRAGVKRNRVTAGVLLPIFFGWLGVLIVVCLSTDHPPVVVYQQPTPPPPPPYQQHFPPPPPPSGR